MRSRTTRESANLRRGADRRQQLHRAAEDALSGGTAVRLHLVDDAEVWLRRKLSEQETVVKNTFVPLVTPRVQITD
jgi:hypothetical protein